jgi:hypothetical protein
MSHLSAIRRADTIPGFDENDPVAALALSAVAVRQYLVPYTLHLLTHHCQAECVLKLWRNGHFTWESTTMHNGKQ